MSSRREFLQSTAAMTAGVTALSSGLSARAFAQGSDQIKVGLIGCGGRGTGAMGNAFAASSQLKLVAMGDVFEDAIGGSLKELQREAQKLFGPDGASKVDVPPDRQFVGFDAYQKVIDSGVDLVIMATPPGFRPMHFEAAVKAGKNCFVEKPVAVDALGVQQVLAAASLADAKGLKVGIGLQRRHQKQYLEYIDRIHNGEFGDVHSLRVYWNGGGVWEPRRTREECKTEMEYQLRNWYYYNWLCGDHIVEQHIHNLDVGCWIKGDKWPVKANGMGGRQVRTDKRYGEIFDHHACEFFFDDGSVMVSQCRHIKSTWGSISEHAHCTKGIINLDNNVRGCSIQVGKDVTRYKGQSDLPYVVEHATLQAAIAKGEKYNEAHRGAMSTMVAILGRMCTYSGKEITWDEAINSKIALRPSSYTMDGTPPSVPNSNGEYPIAVPGVTKTV
jgi:myo-inositol 2-dehydrogenase / D-chiro-inositol 1-dehydrogenase